MTICVVAEGMLFVGLSDAPEKEVPVLRLD